MDCSDDVDLELASPLDADEVRDKGRIGITNASDDSRREAAVPDKRREGPTGVFRKFTFLTPDSRDIASCRRSVAAMTLSSSPFMVVHALICSGGALRRLFVGDAAGASSRMALSSLLHVLCRDSAGGGTSRVGPWSA